jgi:hypothetical protein
MIKKRILGLALAACMTLAALPAAAVPADAAEASGKCGTAAGVTWSLSGGVLTISGSGDMLPDGSKGYGYEQYKDSITSAVIGDGVTGIGENAFYQYPNLASVTAASSVRYVGGLAFSACPKLAAVTFRGSGVEVNANAFSRCTALTAVPAGLGDLGMGAFSGCTGLKALNLYEGITHLDWSVFAGCTGAKSLSLPRSLTQLEFSAFDVCTGITSVTVASGSSFLSAQDNMLLSTTYGGGKALVLAARNKTGTVTVPDGVTEIENTAFAGCTGVTAVRVPASVTAIYDSTYSDSAFDTAASVGCKNLKTVYYAGTKAQWSAVKIQDGYFKNAAVQYGAAAGTGTGTASGDFTDVKSGAYYYDSVKWAVEKGITKGTTATTFSPGQLCTRAQIITFLWRASGSPEPSGSGSVAGVSSDAYYAKAVQWAAENNIIYPQTFLPDQPCTRFMAVEFIWKQRGMPQGSPSAGFTDVPDGTEFTKAVDWAVASGVTKGTSATEFSPFKTCTRGQIATFLYRALADR